MATSGARRRPQGRADQIAAKLIADVLTGRVPPGGRFPSERVLAEKLDVNRLTLRHAFAKLVAHGLVEVRPGGGITARDWRRHATVDLLAEMFAALGPGAERLALLAALLELHRVASAEVAALAAVRHTPAQLRAVEQRIDELERVLSAGKGAKKHWLKVADAEMEIDRAVVASCGNVAFALLHNAIARFVHAVPRILEVGEVNPEVLLGGYRHGVELIRAHDAQGARETTLAVLGAVHQEILRRFEAP